MDVQSAIHLIEESPDYEQFTKLRNIFKDRLGELKETDFTERGICYYYLLRIVLRSHLMYETEECRDYLANMDEAFHAQLKKYKKDHDKFAPEEINDFFRLMERSYGSLEIIFRKKDFFEEEKHCYEKKMDYRKGKYWAKRSLLNWIEYTFLGSTSRYGNSFVRWGLTAFIFALAMAGVYAFLDWSLLNHEHRIVGVENHWYDYIYFSIIAMTSLGFGDFVPHTFISKLFVSMEAFFGFIMLGIFISLIQKKM